MRLAEFSVPKINPEVGNGNGGGLFFCPLKEGVSAFAARTAGKLLLVSDGGTYHALASAANFPRAISVVLDGEDALPLFSMPDGVGGVFAAGGEKTLRAARLFAQVRRVPCALSPSDSALEGVFEARGEVCVGEKMEFPLAAAEIYCDTALLKPSLAEGYGRLLLSRLALFEARAKSLLLHEGQVSEEAFGLLTCLNGEMSSEEIVRVNADLRKLEGAGAEVGEGIVLARSYACDHPNMRAYCELSSLYAAFFKCGRPRKYAVPDYAARAAAANVLQHTSIPPTVEEYAGRAFILEQRRAECMCELQMILRRNGAFRRTYSALAGKPFQRRGNTRELGLLPERAPHGLSRVIRDFGLMEEL